MMSFYKSKNKIILCLFLLFVFFSFLTVSADEDDDLGEAFPEEDDLEISFWEDEPDPSPSETEQEEAPVDYASLSGDERSALYDEYFGPADNIGDVTELEYELVWTDGVDKIFRDLLIDDVYWDLEGRVSNDVLISLGILTEEDLAEKETISVESSALSEPVQITLDVNTTFLFNTEGSYVYDIYLVAYGAERFRSDNSSYSPEFANIHLSRDNDFSASATFECTDDTFYVYVYIPEDRLRAYDVYVNYNNYEQYVYPSDRSEYELDVMVYKPDNTITSINDLDDDYFEDMQKFLDGSYAESRAAANEEPQLPAPEYSYSERAEEEEEEPFSVPAWAIFLLVFFLIVGGAAFLLYYLHKRANS